ncbi:hypothetical protein BP5796_10005 [Coleophoma crateriformis]|uniref:PEBP-like protein n=1 Tax=Coleophoma crateriformis TaxID=565419 RepID=A0A3D8QU00_9HELO|nr:hypothetical protein BP5796_10005 [Coleophoma crateriformis]
MRAGSFSFVSVAATATMLVGLVSGMTPTGVFPQNSENMTNFFDTSTAATNGVNIPRRNTNIAPTLALDKAIANKTFAVVMFDPDTPATGVGGNGTNSFLHWFQDGLTSSVSEVDVAGKNVTPLVNVFSVAPLQTYVQPSPPTGQTHRYVQILLDTTGVTGFVVSAATGNATTSRTGFDMNAFVKESGLTVFSSNFFNVTGV